MLNRETAIEKMNRLGAQGEAFVFFTDFAGEKAFVQDLHSIHLRQLAFNFNGIGNAVKRDKKKVDLKSHPISIETFSLGFNTILKELNLGNSYLTNLTFETKIENDLELEKIYNSACANYKIRYRDDFVCFSPEIFIKIKNNKIRSFPMKGTINAYLPNARNTILSDSKEIAEHVTIVDLIRNDLSQVSSNVRVERFRYIEEINTPDSCILQVSSQIAGDVEQTWKEKIGTILFTLLPAGSISGAPKTRTIQIIQSVESHTRGFYTGICGLFDGTSLDSGVMIRFIEKRKNKLYYKSGGGITAQSVLEKEYQEYIDKIYVPIH